MQVLPILLKDGYKVDHRRQYPDDCTHIYSNLTPRRSRRDYHSDGVIFFGLQYFIDKYLDHQFQDLFFNADRRLVIEQYKRRIDNYLGPNQVGTDHIGALHDLGYLPLHIKAVPEGSLVPYGVPVLTIVNTHPDFFWLTNVLETLMSSVIWKASTSATTALHFRRNFENFAKLTGAPREFIPWQGHDFSFRGMCGEQDAMVSGAAHLLSFTGTDTIPAIDFLEEYYEADSDNELVGGSVAATEHSVMSMSVDGPKGELDTFRRLITQIYPGGIVSVVSDTWDLWRVLTEYLPALRSEVLARDGKLVIRPDSGDPVKVVCGDPDAPVGSPQRTGVLGLLWKEFGGSTTATGHQVLDPHVGVIYGDGINIGRQVDMLHTMHTNGWASSNIVLGMGSYTYQYVTRDTDGWAVKATAGWTKSRGMVPIFKDPVTDDGTKKSATGLLSVVRGKDGGYELLQDVDAAQEAKGALESVWRDGQWLRRQKLADIRAIVERWL